MSRTRAILAWEWIWTTHARSASFFIFLSVIFLVATQAAGAQSNNGSIEVIVQGMDGRQVNGAHIILLYDGSSIREAYTPDYGNVTSIVFSDLLAGDYVARAELVWLENNKTRMAEASGSVSCPENGIDSITLTLSVIAAGMPTPVPQYGNISIFIQDGFSKPIDGARVRLTYNGNKPGAPVSLEAMTSNSLPALFKELAPGDYLASVTVRGMKNGIPVTVSGNVSIRCLIGQTSYGTITLDLEGMRDIDVNGPTPSPATGTGSPSAVPGFAMLMTAVAAIVACLIVLFLRK